MKAYLSTYIVLQCFWLAGAVAAFKNGMLTVTQMQQAGINKGLPYLWHFGMTNDAVVLHAFLALVAALFWPQWAVAGAWVWAAVAFGIVTSFAANYCWTRGTSIIEAHNTIVWEFSSGAEPVAHAGGKMSAVAMVHVPHMAVIMGLLFLFAVWTCKGLVPWKIAVGGACIAIAHVIVGFHWPVKIFNPTWSPAWTIEPWIGFSALAYGILMAAALAFLFSHFLDPAIT